MNGWRTETGPFVLLTRHFFGRLFRNDTIDFEDQMKEKLIVVLSLLSVFFGWASGLLLFKYHFVPDIGRSWQEKNYIFTLMMLVFGLVTLLEWDVLFPDRRDFLNLAPLPVQWRTLFAAKLASFVLFIGLFSAAMMSLSAVLFSMYLTQWRSDTVGLAVRYVAAHLGAGFAAGCAVFFGVVFLQLLLMTVLPEVLYRRASTALRFVLAAGLLFLLLSFVIAPSALGHVFDDLASLKETGNPFMFRYPPLWFVGLYEVLLGTRDPVFEAEARTAVLCLVLALVAFLGSAAASYRRHVLKTLEEAKPGRAVPRLREAWNRILAGTVLRTPEERAVYGFFAETIRSSPKHRMALVHYLAGGAAGTLALVAAYRSSFRILSPGNGFLLVLPLLLAFAAVVGTRVLVDRPAAPEANWIFRLTETPRPDRYAAGLKKAVILRFLVPLFLGVLAIHALIWDLRTALLHAGFGLVVSILGVEAVFFRYRKVPFACTWVPGRLKLHATAIPCLTGLMLLMMALAAVEKAVLAAPSRALTVLGLSATAALGLRWGNGRFYRGARLRYEEEPEAAMIELGSGD